MRGRALTIFTLSFAALLGLWANPGLHAVELELLGQTVIPGDLEVDGTLVGGLSGLTYDAGCNLYYALSDDRGDLASPRFFSLRLNVDDDLVAVDVLHATILRGVDGAPFTRGDLDPEALALANDGVLYLASEGVPHRGVPPRVERFRLDGSVLGTLPIPDHYLRSAEEARGVHDNLGFEGLALSPDGRFLFAAAENALLQDGPLADLETESPSRLVVFDLERGAASAEYLYVVGKVPDEPVPAGAFRMNGVSEILALDDHRLLVLERSFSAGVGNTCRLYLVDLTAATDILGINSLEAFDEPAPVAAEKVLVADLAELGVEPDNLEGMAFGPALGDGRRLLVMVSDNNFQPSVQESQVLVFAVTGAPEPVVEILSPRVHEIQGPGHFSPLVGRCVSGVEGVVTAILGQKSGQAFWLQDLESDDDAATSEGVFVTALEGTTSVSIGDSVRVDGRVEERSWGMELPVTRIVASRIEVVGRGVDLPAPVVIGTSGRVIPCSEVASRNLEIFDPSRFAADAFESLEGMRVRVEQPVIVGPTSRHGEFVVVGDAGRGSAPRTAAGGLRLTSDNVQPQRVVIDDALVKKLPQVTVGDSLGAPVEGILHYTYGSYKLLVTAPITNVDQGARGEESTRLKGGSHSLTVGTFNLENLWAGSELDKYERLARIIAHELSSPDILAVQEIQDDTGPKNDGTVTAEETLARLVESVVHTGGPRYEWRSVNPENNTDGGQPGANIRTVLLFNPDRVHFVDMDACGSDSEADIEPSGGLNCSPGLIQPANPAFAAGIDGIGGSRKPLVGEFAFDGRRVFVIDLHLVSKGGDDPIFGRRQPPVAGSTVRRTKQVRVVADFVARIATANPNAAVIVLGDFNDFEWSEPLRTLEDANLTDLVLRVPADERYTYVYLGNSQALDHVLVDSSLVTGAEIDIVHANADLPDADRASDHDPIVVRLEF